MVEYDPTKLEGNGQLFPKRPNADAHFYWKKEYQTKYQKMVWVLEIKNSPNPHTAVFSHLEEEASPKDLAKITVETYGANYDQVFVWKRNFLGIGKWVSVFRE